MAAPILPQDVAEHLEAAIELSNRRVHLRFLDEAELLLTFNLTSAAVLVSGVVLETILGRLRESGSENRQRLEKWLQLRNGVAHAQVPTVTLDQATEMIQDVRRSLTREPMFSPRIVVPKELTEPIRQVRGKYKFVPTSAAEFIRKKADELRLEDDDHGH